MKISAVLAAERIKQTTTYKLHVSTLSTKLEQELANGAIIEQKLQELRNKNRQKLQPKNRQLLILKRAT